MDPITKPQLDVFLNNNPRSHTELTHGPSGQVETLQNEPMIIVSGEHFPDGEHHFRLEVDGEVLSAGTVTVTGGAFREQIGGGSTFLEMYGLTQSSTGSRSTGSTPGGRS